MSKQEQIISSKKYEYKNVVENINSEINE